MKAGKPIVARGNFSLKGGRQVESGFIDKKVV